MPPNVTFGQVQTVRPLKPPSCAPSCPPQASGRGCRGQKQDWGAMSQVLTEAPGFTPPLTVRAEAEGRRAISTRCALGCPHGSLDGEDGATARRESQAEALDDGGGCKLLLTAELCKAGGHPARGERLVSSSQAPCGRRAGGPPDQDPRGGPRLGSPLGSRGPGRRREPGSQQRTQPSSVSCPQSHGCPRVVSSWPAPAHDGCHTGASYQTFTAQSWEVHPEHGARGLSFTEHTPQGQDVQGQGLREGQEGRSLDAKG